MNYNVHRLEIDMENGEERLEKFLNRLQGEVVSIIPNIRKTSLIQIFGISRKINYLLIVEKLI